MRFIIGGLKKTSLLDYPEKISAIVFTQGCNFRCGYCHNPGLLKNSENGSLSIESFFEFLKTRQGKLDGVVITGGEPTLQPDLKPFIQRVKELGFFVKLDTNGCNPDIIEDLINKKIVDYIAMDIKAPLEKYSNITNVNIDLDKIKQSIYLIMKSGIDYEFRTTVVKSQLTLDDFDKIALLINGAKKYYLQKFTAKSDILDNSLKNEKTYTNEEFCQIISRLKNHIETVDFR